MASFSGSRAGWHSPGAVVNEGDTPVSCAHSHRSASTGVVQAVSASLMWLGDWNRSALVLEGYEPLVGDWEEEQWLLRHPVSRITCGGNIEWLTE